MHLSKSLIPTAIVGLALLSDMGTVPGFSQISIPPHPAGQVVVGPGCASISNTEWHLYDWWGEAKGHGYCGDDHWTYANGNQLSSYMVWSLKNQPKGRQFSIDVYVPNVYSNVTDAHYVVFMSDKSGSNVSLCINTKVDQEHKTNEFVTLTLPNLTDRCTMPFDGDITVQLGDDGGSPHDLKHYIGGDAVRFNRWN